MINLYQSLTKSWSYATIWMLFVIPSFALSVDEHHKKCNPSFTCANQRNLSYPFWIPERKECGHPDFKVNCSGELAEFSRSSVKFQILENKGYSIRLARKDYQSNLCPRHPENVTINQDVLPFSPDTMLSIFYYNCSAPRVDVPPGFNIRQLDCGNDTGRRSYFVSSALRSWDRAILENSSASCERNVSIPVSRYALSIEDGNPTLEAIEKALKDGFEVMFTTECWECKQSQGSCGYNDSSRSFVCYCVDGPHKRTCPYRPTKSELTTQNKPALTTQNKLGIAGGFLGSILLAGAVLCFIWRRKRLATQNISKGLSTSSIYPTMEMGTGVACGFLGFRKSETSHHPRDHQLKALVQLKQYSYAEVKRITKSFSHTIGTGGFGTVYGGNLCNGRKVAVKVLKNFKSNGEDFINEVASMSQTSHVNIVSLLGFCYEGCKRAIVYEFLANGSLDQFISKKSSLNLDTSTLYGIALGVARGLEYLHHGCKTRIVHFDIKPQNILLDDNLCPKVSDFGLAKLCEKRESILSLLDTRGTIGYIAPEVFSRIYGRASYKSDVYSYGMLVLEMIGARNKETVETAASDASSTYFPDWIYKDLVEGEHTWVTGDATKEEKEVAKKMILVGLWCIQSCPSNRPPMNRVVEMMEGSLDAIEVPPKHSLQLSAAPLAESSWLSEENSDYSEVLL
ncbi:LEAF RUST 10 DISEASE-RESISTANCE LOCUS RECEPTOR-LIKE PROTEIN KINASE-like 2.1 [Brassica napus]|uniref:LEAF RUST 10 DISEASE-RESISTANCE LOCUS RECEPTOR-LIKE PROTEIN KINASE-like 2.1 n=1 Tax=Brassica napus TaxID=3708 RepID=UPI0020791E39|nr:LEAF RUST 10 DISEASE-RESISTANCE LOCUS RECEPTOR-LIKE PROTEIN KINASE-like 2.1 [Brassica napus]